jgi:crotonobetainyl-CoA:carnitine CoA-transferase CaiB-like acyl-CoA transferase
MTLPLTGIRILAVEQYGAGPYGTLHLAALGAEIIKIETPGTGDVSRFVGPHFIDGEKNSSNSYFFQGLNHNKKSIAIDLKTDAGKSILKSLVKTSDGLISNVRGDVVDELGLTYESLKENNRQLVCAHLTAYGRTGERANWPGYDYVMQAQAGYFSLTGEPDGPPTRFGLSVVDLQTGVTLAMALLAGIVAARSSGEGRDIDVSLFDVALHNLNYVAVWSLNAGHHQKKASRSAHFSMTPCQLYRTKDSWIYLMCNKEKFWVNLCKKIQREDLLVNDKYVDFSARLENRDELTETLDETLSAKSTADWLELFGSQVPSAPVLSVEESLNQEFVKKSGRIINYETKTGASVKVVRPPVHLEDGFTAEAAPAIGEQTNLILQELGYSAESIEELRRNMIIQ